MCVKFIIGGPAGHVRAYNNCNKCMIVTVAWSNGKIVDARVEAHSYTDIRYLSSAGNIVGERPCS